MTGKKKIIVHKGDDLSKVLAKVVTSSGQSRYAIAKAASVAESALSRALSGERKATWELLKAVCDGLGFDVELLVSDEGNSMKTAYANDQYLVIESLDDQESMREFEAAAGTQVLWMFATLEPVDATEATLRGFATLGEALAFRDKLRRRRNASELCASETLAYPFVFTDAPIPAGDH